jgi:hypothetical protein
VSQEGAFAPANVALPKERATAQGGQSHALLNIRSSNRHPAGR